MIKLFVETIGFGWFTVAQGARSGSRRGGERGLYTVPRFRAQHCSGADGRREPIKTIATTFRAPGALSSAPETRILPR